MLYIIYEWSVTINAFIVTANATLLLQILPIAASLRGNRSMMIRSQLSTCPKHSTCPMKVPKLRVYEHLCLMSCAAGWILIYKSHSIFIIIYLKQKRQCFEGISNRILFNIVLPYSVVLIQFKHKNAQNLSVIPLSSVRFLFTVHWMQFHIRSVEKTPPTLDKWWQAKTI